MICTACGKVNIDGSAFCEQCGARLQAQPAVVPGAAAPGPPPAAPGVLPAAFTPPPAAPVAPGASALIASLSMGEKVAGAGAVAGLIGFFLPWRTGAVGAAQVSVSGLDLAKTLGTVYLIPLVSIAAAGIVYTSSKAPAGKKLIFAGFLMLLGAFGGPGDLSGLLFVSSIQSVAGFGMWLSSLGLTAVMAGGLMTIMEFSKRVY